MPGSSYKGRIDVVMERRSGAIRNMWIDAAKAMDEEFLRLHDEIRELREECSVLQNSLAEANADKIALLAELDAYQAVEAGEVDLDLDDDDDDAEEVIRDG